MKRLTGKEFIDRSIEIHKNKYDYSLADYINSYTNIIIICPEHGKFTQRPGHHLDGNGCPKCGNTNSAKKLRAPLEKFIEQSNEVHNNKYNYSKFIYKNANNNGIIICPHHGEFLQSPNNHLNKCGCPKCNFDKKRTTLKEFIKRSNKIHSNKYNYDKFIYINAHKKGIIICSIHGEFLQSADSHLNGRGCPTCGLNKTSMSIINFIEYSNNIYNNKYDYSKFIFKSISKKGLIICPCHGIFNQRASVHLNGFGCPKCSIDEKCMKLEEFIDRSNKIHNNKYNYSKLIYKNTYTNGIIICPDHGEFYQRPDVHLNGSGCPKCCNIYSKKCEDWINSFNNLNIQKGVRMKISGSLGNLEFDGFDKSTNTIYEFYGDFWHGNPNTFDPDGINPCIKKTYGNLYENTMKRETMIKEAGFTLITIWERNWDENNDKKRV